MHWDTWHGWDHAGRPDARRRGALFLAFTLSLATLAGAASSLPPQAAATLPGAGLTDLWQQVQRVLPADATSSSCFGPSMAANKFGFSLDVDGDRLAVGMRGSGDGENGCLGPGAVYVFERVEGAWVQQAKLDGMDYELRGFGVDVGISGDVLVVGAPYAIEADDGDLDHGAAFIFERDGDAWLLKAKVTDPVLPEGWDYFGKAVAASGRTVVVGAPSDNSVAYSSGSVFVYESVDGSWQLTAQFKGSERLDVFGAQVAIQGDTMFAASPNRDKVHVFARAGAGWGPSQVLSGLPGDGFGASVALDGDVAVAGAALSRWWGGIEVPGVSEAGVSTRRIGSASIFERTSEGWELAERFDNPRPKGRDSFGQAVAVEGDRVVVTAPDFSVHENSGGIAYVYERTPQGWALATALLGDDTTPHDWFGSAAVIAGGAVVLSAPMDDNRSDGSPQPLDDVSIFPPCEWQGNVYLACGARAGTVYTFEPAPLGVLP